MKITSDWHIHTRNSFDSASIRVADLIKEAEVAGITDFGIADHINTRFNLPDLVNSRREFDACDPSPRFHFGIEVSCMSKWELEEVAAGRSEKPVCGIRSGGPPGAEPAIDISKDMLDELGVEYVIGGVHWPLYVPLEREDIIRDYHRQNMYLATHPLVDIVAHPWSWLKGNNKKWVDDEGHIYAEPWFDDFRVIPQSMHDDFAAAAIDNDTLVEINVNAILTKPAYPEHFKWQYMDYLVDLKQKGVIFSLGSDCHGEHYSINFEHAERMLESAGISEADIWVMPPRCTD